MITIKLSKNFILPSLNIADVSRAIANTKTFIVTFTTTTPMDTR